MRYERALLDATASLVVDHPDGLIIASGRIVNLSEEGCQLRVYKRVEAQLPGRVKIECGAKSSWFPVTIRWTRDDAHEWMVGCEFDRPTPEKQHAIRALLKQDRRTA